MALIKSIAIFRRYIKVAFTFSENAALPNLDLVELRHIVPIIGNEAYVELNQQISTATGNDPNAITWSELCNLINRVTAPLSMLQDFALRHLSFTDHGIKKLGGEETSTPFRWEYNEVREQLLSEVAYALNDLWKHLYEKGDDYQWEDPNEIKLLIKTASQWVDNRLHPLHQAFRIFPMLQPVMAEVESDFINKAIGEEFFEELKGKSAPTDAEKKVIQLIRRAIAKFTVYKATLLLPVKITDRGLTVPYLDTDTDSLSKGDRHAPDQTLSTVANAALADARTYIRELKQYLNETASDTVFPTYKSSTYYVAPDTERSDPNQDSKIFIL